MSWIRRIYEGLAFRIFLPFAVAIGVAMAVVAFYYPSRQAAVYRDGNARQNRELARVTALGIELALERESFQALAETIALATKASDFAFVALVQRDSAGAEFVIAANTAGCGPGARPHADRRVTGV